jgi:hypothetical protein
MNKQETNKAEEILSDLNRMVSGRCVWESHWNEIAQRILPAQADTFARGSFRNAGQKNTQLVFDATAGVALSRFSAILDSLLTPRNQTWHRVKASDPKLNKNREVSLWFEEVNRQLLMHRYAPKANFASQNQQNYKSLGAFGTGCLFVDNLQGGKGLRYRNVHLGEIYFEENHQGIVDHAIRHFPLTARQAVQMFQDSCPEEIKNALASSPDKEFYFAHCVKPNKEMMYGREDYRGMPFSSYYVSVETKKKVAEGGFQTFPYAISRYEQAPGEVYGRGPAMEVLPAIKTLNEQKKTMLKQGHRAVDPVLLAHDDGIVDTFSMKPGSINSGGVTADGRTLVHALPVGNISMGKEMMEEERKLINDAFLVTIFQILIDTPQMTATEVMERTREKGILLAPTIGRQQSEYLGPMIEREIDLLSRQGILPPMPQMLLEAKGEYTIQYDSPLSRAQRAEEAAGVMRSIEMTLNVVNVTQNMEPLDFYDWDTIVPEVNEINAVPARWMRDIEAVKAIREGRAEQMQAQQTIQAAPAAAAMVKAIKK